MWLGAIEGRITEPRSAAAHFHLCHKKTRRERDRDFKLLNASQQNYIDPVHKVPNAS